MPGIGVEIPDEIVASAVTGLSAGSAGLAAWVVKQRGRDRRTAIRAVEISAAALRREQAEWREEIKRDRDDAYARIETLERRLDITQQDLKDALDRLAARTRQLDIYENELSVQRGENAVMKIQLVSLQEQIHVLQAGRSAT